MWRRHADRGDNPDPGIQHYIEKIVDEQRAIRQRTQSDREASYARNLIY